MGNQIILPGQNGIKLTSEQRIQRLESDLVTLRLVLANCLELLTNNEGGLYEDTIKEIQRQLELYEIKELNILNPPECLSSYDYHELQLYMLSQYITLLKSVAK